MTSIILAGRSADMADAATSSASRARRAAAAFFAFARSRLQAAPELRLDDHLLQDIGLTRADYEALRG